MTAISKKPTTRERLLKTTKTRHPSVSGGGSCKRKLALTPIEELTDSGPSCKKQRTFINTPSELVKDFSALLSKPHLPEKVKESVLIRFEQASSRKMTPSSATPRTASGSFHPSLPPR